MFKSSVSCVNDKHFNTYNIYTLNTENTHFKDRILPLYPELGRSLGAVSLWFSCERVPLCKISRVTGKRLYAT